MKVLKFITASAICMLTLFACSDSKTENVPDDPKEEPKSEGVDYLVMFYAQGGETLDECILGNVYQASTRHTSSARQAYRLCRSTISTTWRTSTTTTLRTSRPLRRR